MYNVFSLLLMTKGKDLFINFKILSLLFFCLILDSLNKLKDQLST